jgi:hypothetical protein
MQFNDHLHPTPHKPFPIFIMQVVDRPGGNSTHESTYSIER